MTAADIHASCRAAGLPLTALGLAGMIMLAGCSRTAGPTRYPVSGTVTFGGRPLAAGRISFEPDTDRGNKGPGGYGDIVNGRYTTYRGMGAVGGPHRVVIEGYNGDTPEKLRRRRLLFPPFITQADLPLAAVTVDFDVPTASSPPEAAATADTPTQRGASP